MCDASAGSWKDTAMRSCKRPLRSVRLRSAVAMSSSLQQSVRIGLTAKHPWLAGVEIRESGRRGIAAQTYSGR